MKKRMLMLTMIAAFAMALTIGVKAEAGGLGKPRGSYGISYMNKDATSVTISFGNTENYKEVQILSQKKKLVESQKGITAAFFNCTKKNRLYYYRFRELEYDINVGDYVPITTWSKAKPFATAFPKVSKAKGLSARFTMPKVTGIAKFKVYLGLSRNGKFTLAKTIKKGKSGVIKKYKGKKFVYYKNYYYKVVPILSNGKKTEGVYMNGFYFRKVVTYR